MKKILSLIMLLLIVVGCGGQRAEFSEDNLMNDAEITKLFAQPDEFKDRSIIITGKVFTEPEHTDDLSSLQAWHNPKDNEGNFIVYFDSDDSFKSDDYIKIEGVVEGEFTGENAFGGEVIAPIIHATSIKKTTYEEAEAPALKSVDVNKKLTKHGVSINIKRIDFAKEETRVYLEINNKTNYDASIYTYSTKLIDNNKKQYKEEYSYNFEHELDSDVSDNAKVSGALVYQPIDFENISSLRIKIEGSIEDSNYNSLKYDFKINIK